jgi:hypothetical protein
MDKMEALEKEVHGDIEIIVGTFKADLEDIDNFIGNLDIIIAEKVDAVKEKLLDVYMPKAILAGKEYAEEIQKKIDQDKTIKVDDSKDPQLNKEAQSADNVQN